MMFFTTKILCRSVFSLCGKILSTLQAFVFLFVSFFVNFVVKKTIHIILLDPLKNTVLKKNLIKTKTEASSCDLNFRFQTPCRP